MNEFSGLNIEKIYIIIHKFEKGSLDFVCPCRQWDGFVLITSGKGYAIDKNGKRHDLDTGDVFFLRKGDNYETHLEDNSSYVTTAFDLGFDGSGDFPVSMPFVVSCNQKNIQKIMSICEKWQSRSWDSYTRCRISLLEFYLDILKRQMEKTNMDKDISMAISYVQQNFKNNFSGEELAKFCSLSPSYLRAKFLKETGLTITAYRNELRISAAKEMLNSGCFSITEIAHELGYCDIYHFSKVFKKETGISPSDYISKHLN